MRVLPALALSIALLALPGAVAQQHDHGAASTAVIAHDTPAGGRTYVGAVTSFAVIDDANNDLAPDVHQNNHIRVTLNGAVLWEASAAAGHDYDGVNTFSIVFPTTGAYEVALLGEDGKMLAGYSGTVEAPANPVTASVSLDAPASVAALQPTTFTVKVEASGELLPHSDAVVEVRRGDDLVFRTHAHTHRDPMRLTYAFPQPGTYTVRATGYLAYPTGSGPEYAPAAAERTVEVGAPQVPEPQSPLPALAAPALVPDNLVVTGTTKNGPYKLFGTYDPYTVAGPGTQMHLAALVMDPATGGTLQHVNFAATLTGPQGLVFGSESLHEYDGVYEVVAKQPIPGPYTLAIDAQAGNWTGHVELPYTVALPPGASGLGPVTLALDAATATAGTATTFTLRAQDAAGRPYSHSEVDVEVRDAAGTSLLWTKLHTHADGLFPLTFAFPAAGEYRLRLAPTALDGLPTNYLDGAAAVEIPVTVGAGPGLPALPATEGMEDHAAHPAPGAGILLTMALLGLAVLLRRR